MVRHAIFTEENVRWLRMVGYLLLIVQGIIAILALVMFTAEVGSVIDNSGMIVTANIRDYGDAYWCTFTSATTIGYGDYYPITIIGKIVGGTMYYVGMAMMGVVGSMIGVKLMQIIGVMSSPVENHELKEQNATIIQQGIDQQARSETILKLLKGNN